MHLFILFSSIGFCYSLVQLTAGEPVHIVNPLGATFLRQRAGHLRVDPSGPRGASSGDVPPPPSSTGAIVETSGSAAATADVPPPTTSDDSDI